MKYFLTKRVFAFKKRIVKISGRARPSDKGVGGRSFRRAQFGLKIRSPSPRSATESILTFRKISLLKARSFNLPEERKQIVDRLLEIVSILVNSWRV